MYTCKYYYYIIQTPGIIAIYGAKAGDYVSI